MLLTLNDITAAMNVTPADIKAALARNGYIEDAPLSANYMGMTANGSFVHNVSFNDHISGTVEDGMIYVHYNDKRELVADY